MRLSSSNLVSGSFLELFHCFHYLGQFHLNCFHSCNVYEMPPITDTDFVSELSSRVPTVPTTLEPDSTVDGTKLDASNVTSLPAAPKKPCVGSFGSFSALLSDGMSLSLSIYGDLGGPSDGTPCTLSIILVAMYRIHSNNKTF